MILPQLVPSDYCLKCRGCCIFAQSQGDWGAHLMVEEEIALERRTQGISRAGRMATDTASDGRHACRCLNIGDHHCQVYGARPLECALYPLLLSVERPGPRQLAVRLYAHLACPYVQEKQFSAEFVLYTADVQKILSDSGNSLVLKAAAAVCPDYSDYQHEITLVANVPFNDGSASLLERKSEFDRWFGQRHSRLASRSFVNVVAWLDFFDISAEEADGNMLFFARQRGAEFLLCPPLGDVISPRAVEAAFSRMKGGAARIEAVEQRELGAFNSQRYHAHEQGREYYYDRARVAALAGREYHSKRSDYNSCLKMHSPTFRKFLPVDARACHDLFDRWLDKRRASYKDDIFHAMLVENRVVHRRLIDHADALGLTGRVVEINGALAGYTFGYRLNDETFCAALEITDPGFKGLSAYIFREFCADDELKSFKYINAMDDFGMPGVAKAKRSWRPVFMEKVYSVCLKP